MIKTTSYGDVTRIDSARTIAGRGRYWSTAYLVGDLLVDSGCPHSAPELVNALEDRSITLLINTHSHEDHIGANGKLQTKITGLVILAHPLALPILENPRQELPLQPYRRLMWGWPDPSFARAVNDGEIIETSGLNFQVIYTPGHSPDHLCLYNPDNGWLFSGDLFNGGRDRALRADYDMWEIINSLKRITELPITRLFPGCARVRDNPGKELRDKIDYLEEVGGEIQALHKRGHKPKAIVRALFPTPMWIEVITLGHFSRLGLVKAYLRSSPS
jgi:glyoxylase-like metal-dependent hydrolase (beta-lactamase superfamily II)